LKWLDHSGVSGNAGNFATRKKLFTAYSDGLGNHPYHLDGVGNATDVSVAEALRFEMKLPFVWPVKSLKIQPPSIIPQACRGGIFFEIG